MDNSFFIGDCKIGCGGNPFIIAEVAQAHDGSLGMAHAFIDAIAEAGADAVKFQTHIASAESTSDEPFRVKFSHQDSSRYAYWRRMEFQPDQWVGLASHAQEKGLIFLSSPFSIEAVHLLRDLGMSAWKVGSGEVSNLELLKAMLKTRGPILLSSGMSSYDELEHSCTFIRGEGVPFAVFQCASRYPTPLNEVGLNVIDELRRRFECPVGLSDHSGTVFPSLAALARGVDLLEVHVTFDRRMFGPDTIASLTMEDLALVVNAKRSFQTMDQNPIDKDLISSHFDEMRQLFTKSVALTTSLPAGAILTSEVLTLKKPGTGIPPADMNTLIGRQLRCAVSSDRLLKYEDFDEFN